MVCIGSDFYNRDMMLEFSVNTQIAADLGAPALVIIKGEVRKGDDLIESARGTIRDLREAAVEVIGCMLSWSRLSPAEITKFTDELHNAPEDQKTPNVFVLPENPEASASPENAIAK